MCLAIGPGGSARRTLAGRLWWRVAGSPGRLLGAHAAAQLAAAVALWRTSATFSVALGGTALLLMLAWLAEAAPRWSGRSPIHYVRYSTAGALVQAGLLLVEYSDAKLAGAAAVLAGTGLLARTLHEHVSAARHRARVRDRVADP